MALRTSSEAQCGWAVLRGVQIESPPVLSRRGDLDHDVADLLPALDIAVGIPENEQPGLFTRFFRSTTATDRAIQGTGLGLSIASSIVNSHGGGISVASAPGRGTRVTVDLPIAPAHHQAQWTVA